MKKLFALTLILALCLNLVACGSKKVEETTAPAENIPASALEILETTWGMYSDDEKFAIIGGDMNNPVNDAPGEFDLNNENVTYSLLVPEEQLENVTSAASMIHMMNANTFTCAVFRLAEGVTADDFGKAMQEAVQNNRWMCGFPETLVIQNISDAYVLVAFGTNDNITVLMNHLTLAYPESQNIVREAIA